MTSRFHRKASEEADDIALRYERESPGLGDEFTDELLAGLEQVEENPARWPEYVENTRAYRLDRFPYRIVYMVLPRVVVVVTVMHTSRDEGYFLDRLSDMA